MKAEGNLEIGKEALGYCRGTLRIGIEDDQNRYMCEMS